MPFKVDAPPLTIQEKGLLNKHYTRSRCGTPGVGQLSVHGEWQQPIGMPRRRLTGCPLTWWYGWDRMALSFRI